MPDSLKAYRRLLKLYPARFREEYGTPLEQSFRDEYSDADGGVRRVLFWLKVLRDLAISIPLELARELRQDLSYSFRIYARRPVVTLLAISAMALAIGATTGVFSVVNALLLRSLPFRAPERMVQLGNAFGMDNDPAKFHAWARQSTYLEDAAVYDQAEMNLTAATVAARVKVTETSANFFRMLGSEPPIGRAFVDGEDSPGKNGVAIIGYGLWQQLLGGDPRALGSVIHLNGTSLTVVGIARAGLDYPAKTAVWTPTVFDWDRLPKTGVLFWTTIGHRKAGLSEAQAESMFEADAEHRSPGSMKRDALNRPRLIPLREQLAGPVRRASLVLLGAVSFVLLIACANVANLLLTRITERRKELVVRSALGASRARLIQQLVSESLVLTFVSAGAGLIVATWATRLATAAQPAQIAMQDYTVLDWRVLAFAVFLAGLTGIVFGVLPASLIGRLQPAEDLVRMPAAANSRMRRLRDSLVAVQVTLTLVLVGGSIILGRSFLNMLGTDLGFETNHVVTLSVSLAGTRYDTPDSSREYYRQALAHLRDIPGVEAAGAVDSLPLAVTAFMASNFTVESGAKVPITIVVDATPGYFEAMGTRLLAGRGFASSGQSSVEPLAIVNEDFARMSGLGRALIGRRIRDAYPSSKPAKVIGIVANIHFTGPQYPVGPQLFLDAERRPPALMTFAVRVRGATEAYLPICRSAVQAIDPAIPVFNVKSLDERLADTLARPRFYTTAVLFFAGFAILLAIVGVYGVATYSILQRTHELGVRMAIGASARRMRWSLLRQALLPVGAGVILGAACAMGLGRFLEHLIAAAQGIDAVSCAIAALALAAVASIAIWSATRRILRLDPMQVLRAE